MSDPETSSRKKQFVLEPRRADLAKEFTRTRSGFGLIVPSRAWNEKKLLVCWDDRPGNMRWRERDWQGKPYSSQRYLTRPAWSSPKEEFSQRAAEAVLDYFGFSKKRKSQLIEAGNLVIRSPTKLIQTRFFRQVYNLKRQYSRTSSEEEKAALSRQARALLEKMAELGHSQMQADFKAQDVQDPIQTVWEMAGGDQVFYPKRGGTDQPFGAIPVEQQKDYFSTEASLKD